jgi:hypothetical protein
MDHTIHIKNEWKSLEGTVSFGISEKMYVFRKLIPQICDSKELMPILFQDKCDFQMDYYLDCVEIRYSTS